MATNNGCANEACFLVHTAGGYCRICAAAYSRGLADLERELGADLMKGSTERGFDVYKVNKWLGDVFARIRALQGERGEK